MNIKNIKELAVTPARRAALEIAEAGLSAIDTQTVIEQYVRRAARGIQIAHYDVPRSGKLVVIAVGKCALEAGKALERALGDRITAGVVVDVEPGTLENMLAFVGDHPFPSERNMNATRAIISALSDLREEDTALFVVSGGASTLLCQPEHTTCYEERRILQALFAAGAAIREINTVRKHLSLARGGYLAQYAFPAEVISLIFSDVPGDDLSVVASGPTVFDETTILDAEAVAERYNLKEACNLHALTFIETPKDRAYFARVTNVLAVSNQRALDAMAETGRARGMRVATIGRALQGEARAVGRAIAEQLAAAAPHTLLLGGGETTVAVKGGGRGGRNQELVLGALSSLAPDELVVSIASDGRDNGDVAGAIGDRVTLEAARRKGLDPAAHLARNNSFDFFAGAGGHIVTGRTGANVSDLMIAYKGTGGAAMRREVK